MRTTQAHFGWLTILVLALLAPGVVPAEDRRARKLVPQYRHDETRRPESSEPAKRKPLPDALRVVSPSDAARRATVTRPQRAAQPVPVDRGRQAELDQLARVAGQWSADQRVDHGGRREYYRIGFFEGQRAALDEPHVGGRDHRDGRRQGWRDPDARAAGADAAALEARDRAWEDAEAQVIAQFTDLTREPRYLPAARTRTYVADPLAVPAPTLRDVLEDFPAATFGPVHDRFDSYLSGWSWNGLRLARCRAYTDFYDARWRDGRAALEYWCGLRRAAFYASLRPHEKLRFAEVFEAAFLNRVASLFEQRLGRAYDRGFDDGWSYGVFHQELDFRLGYREGFIDAAADAAVAGFQRAYPREYDQAYAIWFDDWNENPQPQIGELRLIDGNEDGVFAPGEQLLVEYELINYGGAAGTFPVRLAGRVLVSGASDRVSLPPRGVVREREPLVGRIRPETPNRTDTRLRFELADLQADLPLRVTHPVEFTRRSVKWHRQNVAGEVIVEIGVQNLSRKPVDVSVEASTASLPGFAERRARDLAPGASSAVTFAFTGLDPLDLIAGSVALDLTVIGGGVEQDRYVCHLPNVARDLGNRDLLVYLTRLATDASVDPARIAAVRELLIQRLREDWKIAAAGWGNPYKRDYKTRTARTALGDLVRTYADSTSSTVRPEVYEGLSDDVIELAARLPGTHPFLRKSMRRLATRLP